MKPLAQMLADVSHRDVCMHACMYACSMYVFMYVCIHVWMYVCLDVHMIVKQFYIDKNINVCVYAEYIQYVCMYVCM